MYNIDQKRKFIEEYTNSPKTKFVCETLFCSLSKYEENIGADLCTFDIDTLNKALDETIGLRSKTQGSKLIIIKNYIKWCESNNIPGTTDAITNINITGIEKIRNSMVVNPLMLQRALDSYLTPESYKTIDNVVRAIYWLAFSGIRFDEKLIDVTEECVDFQNMVIRLDGLNYPIYREAIPCLKNCIESKEFFKKGSRGAIVTIERSSSKSIVRCGKEFDTTEKFVKAIRTLSSRKKKLSPNGATSKDITYFWVWLSGVFYRAHERELAGFPVDFSHLVDSVIGDKEYNLSSGRNTQEAKRRSLAKDYEDDYYKWKIAFNL